MYPLIEITTIPIEIQMKTTPAKLEYSRGTAELEISRDKGGLSIRSRPIRLNLDTYEARSSISPTPTRSVEQNAQKGRDKVYQTTGQYAERGKLLLQAKIGEEMITKFAQESTEVNTDFAMKWLPSSKPEISWDAGEMQIQYEMDKLNMDFRINEAEYQFTPGNIEFSVSQHPDVIIKYIGGPIYVPPSADPAYEPVDVKA